MLRKVIFVLIISLNIISAQSSHNSKDYILKFSALDLLTGMFYQSSTIQFGVEKGVSESMSIEGEIGYSFHINQKGEILSVSLDNSSGFTIETELRNYLGEAKAGYSGQYFSLDILYRYLDAQNHHTVYSVKDQSTSWVSDRTEENYSIYRNETALHLKYGHQSIWSSGIVTDLSIGLGWRYISSRSTNQNPVTLIESEFPYKKAFNEGSSSFLSVTVAIKIGWSIE